MQNEERLEEIGITEEATENAEELTKADTGTDSDTSEVASEEEVAKTDYAELEKNDMAQLKALFPALRNKTSITELENPLRYAALRDLGLSPKEAYLATTEPIRREDNRSHLTSSVPHGAGGGSYAMSQRELDAARELFSGLSDREIRKLYNKVTK